MSSIWTTDDPLSSSPAFLNESVAAESSSGELAVCVDGLVIKAWEPVTGLTVGDRVLRGSVYFAALLYLFLGVSIISDRFMQAIEVITSQEKKVSIRSRGEKKTVLVRVWNETVANLTLMALGSSAPEIMLSVIEIYAKNFVAGDLGPGTIVGSAAYNLFVIIALCVYVIPAGEVRKIKQIGVFFVTATWSVFAYIWLYLILSYFSPGVVEVWEGLLTFLFFPLTVLTAYLTDKKVPIHKLPLKLFKCKSHSAVGAAEAADMEMSNSDYEDFEDMLEHARQQSASLLKELRREYPDKSMGELKAIAQEKMEATGPKSRAFYRIQATRSITGSSITQRPRGDAQHDDRVEVVRIADDNVYVKFDEPEMTVLENVGAVVVKVVVDGPPPGLPLLVDYQSEDGSAQAGSDYMAVSGTLIFKPGQREQMFKVKIIDDDVFEEDEHFYVRLSNPRWQQSGKTNKALSSPVAAGGSTTAAAVMMTLNGGLPPPPKIPDDRGGTVKINILDDDHGGVFGFADDTLDVSESVGTFLATVERKTGARGVVRIPFFTENVTARAGKDYVDTAGSIVFENNEASLTSQNPLKLFVCIRGTSEYRVKCSSMLRIRSYVQFHFHIYRVFGSIGIVLKWRIGTELQKKLFLPERVSNSSINLYFGWGLGKTFLFDPANLPVHLHSQIIIEFCRTQTETHGIIVCYRRKHKVCEGVFCSVFTAQLHRRGEKIRAMTMTIPG
ncbi:unnamed protein product [Nesidiocoris tenuis]|uniref:Calx-beta domain-containing protein n=1 Tax=Nesidiocoris tenuis TaxID=355587 RepID=A0A6H5H8I6_9HEMI|nr:unnamed protein product [Nesidiocoris tenuis]